MECIFRINYSRLNTRSAYTAYMKQITIRRIRESSLELAKHRAKQRGVAMNTVLVEALEKGLGLEEPSRTNGLEKFAGDSDFGPSWDAHLQELKEIDPADWK